MPTSFRPHLGESVQVAELGFEADAYISSGLLGDRNTKGVTGIIEAITPTQYGLACRVRFKSGRHGCYFPHELEAAGEQSANSGMNAVLTQDGLRLKLLLVRDRAIAEGILDFLEVDEDLKEIAKCSFAFNESLQEAAYFALTKRAADELEVVELGTEISEEWFEQTVTTWHRLVRSEFETKQGEVIAFVDLFQILITALTTEGDNQIMRSALDTLRALDSEDVYGRKIEEEIEAYRSHIARSVAHKLRDLENG